MAVLIMGEACATRTPMVIIASTRNLEEVELEVRHTEHVLEEVDIVITLLSLPVAYALVDGLSQILTLPRLVKTRLGPQLKSVAMTEEVMEMEVEMTEEVQVEARLAPRSRWMSAI